MVFIRQYSKNSLNAIKSRSGASLLNSKFWTLLNRYKTHQEKTVLW